jgi:hypothetical protein
LGLGGGGGGWIFFERISGGGGSAARLTPLVTMKIKLIFVVINYHLVISLKENDCLFVIKIDSSFPL